MKQLKKFILPVVLLALVYLVAFQPELLTLSINKQNTIPAGTIISWLFILVFVLIFFFNTSFKTGNLFERLLRNILIADVSLALFWGVISFFLAGNWTFTFDQQNRFYVWIGITVLILILPVLVLVIRLIKRIFERN